MPDTKPKTRNARTANQAPRLSTASGTVAGKRLLPAHWFTIALSLVVALALTPAAQAVNITMTSGGVDESGKARLCVGLDSAGATVAGTQNDLLWDGACATLAKEDCVVSSHHGKPLHGSLPLGTENTYRALVFALDNVDPMADGELYCCDFKVTVAGSDDCCPVTIGRLGSSDSVGTALNTVGSPDRLCLVSGAAVAPVEVEIGPGVMAWLWPVLIVLAVVIVVVLVLRSKGRAR